MSNSATKKVCVDVDEECVEEGPLDDTDQHKQDPFYDPNESFIAYEEQDKSFETDFREHFGENM